MPKAEPKPCETCGCEFKPRWRGGAQSRFCSSRCSGRARAGKPSGQARERVVLKCQGPGCIRTFSVTPGKTSGRRTCSRACADALKRQEQAGGRRGVSNPNYRGGSRVGARSRGGERVFVDSGAIGCRHPRCSGGVGIDQHHVVYRQEIRRLGGDQWDPRVALALCKSCHASHHRRGRWVVPLWALRDENYAYALELLGGPAAYEYLRRRYDGEDPRLDALLHVGPSR